MKMLLWNLIALFLLTTVVDGQTTAGSPTNDNNAILHGSVTDAQTGEPLAKVRVVVIGSDRKVITNAQGVFEIGNLAAGDVDLYISTIGYGLVKKRITMAAGEERDLRVALHQEASSLRDEMTIKAGPFSEHETNVASGYSLDKPELRALSTILVADPVRAAHGLPGVTGNDDFRSDFALRGAGFRRVGFFIDGLLLPENPTHNVAGHEDTGQISILNADTIASVTLLSGAFPSKYGDATAGLLQIETREGNRVKPAGRIAASLLSSSAVFDGPLPYKRGSWLIAARKSYLRYLVRFLNSDIEREPLSTDFTDGLAKAVYQLTPHHQVGVTFIAGSSNLNRNNRKPQFNLSDIFRTKTEVELIYANWDYDSGSSLTFRHRFFGLSGQFINRNHDENPLLEGKNPQWGVRSDIAFSISPDHRLETGIYLRIMQGKRSEKEYLPEPRVQVDFDRRASQQGYYLQDTWSNSRLRTALTVGARIDHTSMTGETIVTPRAALSFSPFENARIRLGWGQYSEFPNPDELFGIAGNPRLRGERATHYNASLEYFWGEKTRLIAEFFDREDKDLIFSLNETRLAGGRPSLIRTPFNNSVYGYARGFELSLHRRSANRFAGWFAYSYLSTRLHDQITGLNFVSDFDQRQIISIYGNYRFTNTINLSAQWRYGTGLPMVGFYREFSGYILPAADRNQMRMPPYSRLDVRANKDFYLKRSKLTLSSEIINVLRHENFRQNGRGRDRLLPFLPSIGLAFEF